MYRLFISPEDLHGLMRREPPPIVFDARFSLADTEKGRRDFTAAHIPGAVYLHLDDDLSGPVVSGKTGRHPLPDPVVFAERLGSWGVSDGRQVVVYDDANGGIAARLWWMLRWFGHDAAAVLDGGWKAWIDAGLPVSDTYRDPAPAVFVPHMHPEMVVSGDEIMAMRKSERHNIVDARTADRFAGLNETIDPIAGHIPGAVNLPYPDTADAAGVSLAPEDLQALVRHRLGNIAPQDLVVYCGSGVTACRTMLALEYAGYGGSRLYPGSWSEWITLGGEAATGPAPSGSQ